MELEQKESKKWIKSVDVTSFVWTTVFASPTTSSNGPNLRQTKK